MTITHFHERLGYDKKTYYEDKGLKTAMTPQEVVEISLQYLEKDKVICIPGRHNQFLSLLIKILSRSFIYKIVSSVMPNNDDS